MAIAEIAGGGHGADPPLSVSVHKLSMHQFCICMPAASAQVWAGVAAAYITPNKHTLPRDTDGQEIAYETAAEPAGEGGPEVNVSCAGHSGGVGEGSSRQASGEVAAALEAAAAPDDEAGNDTSPGRLEAAGDTGCASGGHSQEEDNSRQPQEATSARAVEDAHGDGDNTRPAGKKRERFSRLEDLGIRDPDRKDAGGTTIASALARFKRKTGRKRSATAKQRREHERDVEVGALATSSATAFREKQVELDAAAKKWKLDHPDESDSEIDCDPNPKTWSSDEESENEDDRWFIASDGTGTSEEESPREMGSHDDDDEGDGDDTTGSAGTEARARTGKATHDEDQLQPQRSIDSAQGGTVDCTETTEPKKKRQRKSAEAGPTGPAPDDMASEDDAAPAAHDEDQLQPQRNTDGAQGGTVDCAETTELTCGSTDSAQGGAVDCATTNNAQGGAAVKTVTPNKKRKRKKKKANTPTERLRKARLTESKYAKRA